MTQDYKIILTALNQTQPAFDTVKRSLGDVSGMAKTAALGLAGLGAGVTFGALVAQFNKVIDSAAGLKEMAERTGSTVEQMGALARAAKLTGHDVEQVETGVIKLTKALFAAGDESGTTARALSSVGLQVKELRALDPAEAFRLVAERLNGFADSADKTAVALALFGKNGAQLLPFIKDLGELGEINTKVTRAQAEAADQYQKNMLRLYAASNQLYRSISNELLPVMNELTSAMLEGQKNSTGMITSFGMWLGSKITSPVSMIKNLRQELELLERERRANAKAGWETSNLDNAIAEKRAQLEQAKFLQREQALRGNPRDNEDANDIRLRQGNGKKSIDFKPPEPATAANQSRYNDPLAEAAKLYAATLKDLNLEQVHAAMAGQELTAVQRRLIDVMVSPEFLAMPESWREVIAREGEAALAAEKLALEHKRLNALLAATPSAKLAETQTNLDTLNKAFAEGKIDVQQYAEAVQTQMGTLPEVLKKNQDAFADLQRSIEGWGRDSAAAIVDFATTGKLSFTGMIDSMIKDLLRMMVYRNITKPLFDMASNGVSGALSSLFGGSGTGTAATPTETAIDAGALGFAQGGVVRSPSLSAYSGGVYERPQVFAFARGAGVFAEAGPEAIMPLKRGPDGKLGVAASGGGNVTVNVTVASDGTTRNDGQGDAARLGALIAAVVKSELINQKRPGGLLAA